MVISPSLRCISRWESTIVVWSSAACALEGLVLLLELLLRRLAGLGLLVEALFVGLELALLGVELDLAAVEELLQRRLDAEALLRLQDGAADVDDGHLRLGRGGARRQEQGAAGDRRERAVAEAAKGELLTATRARELRMVAEGLACSPGTVKTRRARGLRCFRRISVPRKARTEAVAGPARGCD